uniref:Uncharacterized protein n=1 Tax=Arundo donax TaxID=35708 RepID=A0A0A8ZQM5_ARUDO
MPPSSFSAMPRSPHHLPLLDAAPPPSAPLRPERGAVFLSSAPAPVRRCRLLWIPELQVLCYVRQVL